MISNIHRTRTLSFRPNDPPAGKQEIAARIKQALGRFHGMRAADPAPTAQVQLGAEKNGTRTFQVTLGNYEARGIYDLKANEVVEHSWRRL